MVAFTHKNYTHKNFAVRKWLPTALGETDPLGRPASNMGTPGRLSADSKSRKTDLRSKSRSRSRDAGARVSDNGERCSKEWVRFGAWNVW